MCSFFLFTLLSHNTFSLSPVLFLGGGRLVPFFLTAGLDEVYGR